MCKRLGPVRVKRSKYPLSLSLQTTVWNLNLGGKSEYKLCVSRVVQIDLTEALLDWYMVNRDAITSCDDIHNLRTRRTRVCVTNHRAYSHQFDCSPKWIAFLCLCWVVFVPCYVVSHGSPVIVFVPCYVVSHGSPVLVSCLVMW